MNSQQFRENFKISLEAIKSHRVRTLLTVAIIAFGIMSLVGILTSIDAIRFWLKDNFTQMGANTLTIRNREMRVRIGGRDNNPKNFRTITYDEAMSFKEEFVFDASTSVYIRATGIATLKYEAEKSNPNITVMGCDENYMITSGSNIALGRNFSSTELQYGAHVVIISEAIKTRLFKKVNPIDKVISVGSGKYKIIGVMEKKGSGMGFNNDNLCLLPVNNVRQAFARPNMAYQINIIANDPMMMDAIEGEATGLFRVIRDVPFNEESNFSISKSDNLAEMLFENLSNIRYATILIGIITLLGAAIGLMNIMLVSVTERTREIGIRKAIGANKKTVRMQFLVEAIIIAQIGGVFGIILGIGIGNMVSMSIGSAFFVPWNWMIVSLVTCLAVAILSGIIPAAKAANLDPIDALRYE
ncbi:MAG: ABC transporter permease [Bacteroidales bacterium]|nr:ABC transporter permease [Bacteroidales bacterium]